MRRRVHLDLDGVLTDFVDAVARFHKKDPSLVVKYGLEECWGMDSKTLWEPLGYDFWANLPLTKEAHQIMDLCEEAVGRDSIFISTSPCLTKGSVEGKLDWVRKHFPDLARRTSVNKDKHGSASPFSLLIDDTKYKCDEYVAWGGHAFLFPRPWNEMRHLAHDPLEELVWALRAFTYKVCG